MAANYLLGILPEITRVEHGQARKSACSMSNTENTLTANNITGGKPEKPETS